MSANESVKVAIRWRPLIKREGDEIIKVSFSLFLNRLFKVESQAYLLLFRSGNYLTLLFYSKMNMGIKNGPSIEFLTKVPTPKTFIKKLFPQLYHRLLRGITVSFFFLSSLNSFFFCSQVCCL